MEPIEGTVLVIKKIHIPSESRYMEKVIEASESTASEQLIKPDAERNASWRGVRYATDEESAAYYKLEPKKETNKKSKPVKIETNEV